MLVAVIVTYNRKMLLKENIEMLLKQTIHFDYILIVDNCSNDGTYEMLVELGWLNGNQIMYIKTESNIGGAGGFYVGTKKAYDLGADWILLMDDDGKAENERTFNLLLDVANKMHKKNKLLFVNSLVQQGDLLSFKIDNAYTVDEAIGMSSEGIIKNAANPFNGTLLSRELVGIIGYPNKDFFIKGDEVDYKQRAYDAGADVVTVVDSRYIHPRPETYEKKVLGIKVPFFVEAPWKEYYAARNFTYMYKRKKHYKAIIFELIFVKLLAIFTMDCPKIEAIKMLFKGVKDGWNGHLGPIVRP